MCERKIPEIRSNAYIVLKLIPKFECYETTVCFIINHYHS